MTSAAAELWRSFHAETDPLAKQIVYLQYLQALNDDESLEHERRPPAMPLPLETRAA